MIDTKNIDKLLSRAFHQYVDEQMTAEFSNVPKFETSASFDRRINRAIKSERNYYYKFTLTRARRILCACIIILIIMLSLLSVGAVREAIAGFFIEHFSNHNSLSTMSDTQSNYPTTIEKVYEPSFIPDGYNIIEEDISTAGVTLIYGYDDKMILFTQDTKSGSGINLDNEYSTASAETIDGQEYYVVTNQNDGHTSYSIHWDNGEYLFEISAELSKDVALNMCKSLKIRK